MDRQVRFDQIRAEIGDPDLLRLFDYWRARVVDGRLPSRKDIDPLDLPALMGSLILVDIERDPPRFRYRLIGTKVTNRVGIEMAGRYVDEHPDPNFRPIVLGIYTQVATTREPMAYRRDELIDGRVRDYGVLVLPLAGDGVTVDMIMACMRFLS
jgi:hypothetical protein